jgi:phage baseplate assembly protein V
MNIKDIDSRIARKLAGIRQPYRGVIGIVNSAPGVSLMQVSGLAGENLQDNEFFQHYGHSSNPPVGSQVIVLPLGGKSSQGVIIACENGAYRVRNLKPGESVIYNHLGDFVHIKDDGSIEIKSSLKVIVHSPLVEVPDGDVTAGGISLKHHKHGGVQAGGAQTGEPV